MYALSRRIGLGSEAWAHYYVICIILYVFINLFVARFYGSNSIYFCDFVGFSSIYLTIVLVFRVISCIAYVISIPFAIFNDIIIGNYASTVLSRISISKSGI